MDDFVEEGFVVYGWFWWECFLYCRLVVLGDVWVMFNCGICCVF